MRVIGRHEAVEEDDPHLARDVVGLGVAEHARAVRHVDGPVRDRADQPLHLLGPVLAVGVERHDDARAGVDHQAVAGAQRGAAAEVGHVARHRGAVLARDVARPVARSVVHHQHRRLQPADHRRDAGEDLADVVLLVVGRDHDRDLVAEALRQPAAPELLPGDALERRRELALDAAVLHERAQGEQEQHDDGEDGEAEDPAAVAALEGEQAEHRVEQLGARDDEQGEAAGQQQQHVAVAQRATAPGGEDEERRPEGEADDAEGGELHGARRIAVVSASTAARGRR